MANLHLEPGHEEIDQLIRGILAGEHEAQMSMINVGELFYMQCRKSDVATAQRSLRFLERAGIRIASATDERVISAAQLKASAAVSYADAFAAALALELDATLVTGDPEFSALGDTVPIMWLPRNS